MESCISITDIAKVEEISISKTYDISVDGNCNYYLDCGKEILVHNSTKTWSIIQFLIIYCQNNHKKNKDIFISREHYSDVKTSVLKDFIKILKEYNIYREEHHVRSHPQIYHLYGNVIYFGGLDSMGAHGERHDIIWINEAMEADMESFRQLNQRCNEIFILDYNPVYTEHWIYSRVIPRPDTNFFKSTQLDNPFLPPGQRDEILAYEPTHPEDRNLPEAQRRPHPTNVINGTADDTLWKVYGLGIRAQPEGVIFKYVTWIDEFPKGLDYEYGMDFGYTNDPTAIVKMHVNERKKLIYAQELCYEPIDNPGAISEMMDGIGVSRNIWITADSSDKYVSATKGAFEMVKDLKGMGWRIQKVSKTHDKNYWITKAKQYKIHLVRTNNFKIEQENYRWRVVNGVRVNQPVDKHNHLWDAFLYRLMGTKKKRRQRMWQG